MDGNSFATTVDLRFGIAVPEVGAAPPRSAGLSTAEFPLGTWKRMKSAWEGELSLRLGGVFADPGAAAVDYARALSECRAEVEALRPSGRLSALLIEFPPSFSYRAAERRHLDRVLKDLEGFPLAAAFLNGEWYSSRVIEGLKRRDVALCLLDLLPGEPGPPSVDIATSSLVYMRCTARRAPAAWIPRLEGACALAERVRVIFDAGFPSGADAASAEASAESSAAALSRLWTERRGASAADRPGPGAPR
ncbi:MAG: DUF72 domain-containing protein [Spirochaetes bacterium]|nr:DUF72 domain-containing protein [Spirochaetota bacterium]